MRLFRNIGGSVIRRTNGEVVEANGVFEPTAKELVMFANEMWLGIRVLELLPDEVLAEMNIAPPVEDEEWTLKISPEDYLKRFPDGPRAELARKVRASAIIGALET